MMNPTHYADLAAEIDVFDDSTISKTLYEGDDLKVVLFGFAAGQELSEHTAAVPAVMHFLEGRARVTLGEEVHGASPNAWIHMPAHLPHSIAAHEPVKMLLLLLRNRQPNEEDRT